MGSVLRGGRVVLIAMMLALATAVGCETASTSDRDLVLVDVDAAPTLLNGKGHLLGLGSREGAWVDPRNEAEYTKGHIPGAIHIPFARLADDHELLSKYNVLIVYGDGYKDIKAEGMAKRLLEYGHKDVRVLRGGVQAWTAAGNTLESGKPRT